MKTKTSATLLALGALVLPLSACNTISASSADSSSSAESSASSETDPIVIAAEAATGYLDYSSQAAEGLTSRTFKTAASIKGVNGYDFTVTYTGVQKTVYDGASISFYQDLDPDLLEPVSTCTVVSPIKDVSNSAKFIVFVMTAHILYDGTEYATADFNIRADPFTIYTVEEVSGLTSGTVVATYGIYEGKYPNATDIYWIGDREAGITAYAPSITGTITAGDYVEILGKYSPYSGLAEIGSCTVKKVDATNANVTTLGVATPVKLVWDGTYALQTKDQSRKIQASGTVGKVTTDTSGNITAAFTVGTGSINIYAKKAAMSTSDYNAFAALSQGSTATIEGYLGCYSTLQILNPTVVS
jgi:hypothetical protein